MPSKCYPGAPLLSVPFQLPFGLVTSDGARRGHLLSRRNLPFPRVCPDPHASRDAQVDPGPPWDPPSSAPQNDSDRSHLAQFLPEPARPAPFQASRAPCITPGAPRMPQGSPISPESARSSRAPQPPSQHQPRAGSTLWAAGWVPASWSWPSGPCCLGEQSQGPLAAPGSPRRLPPLPTRGDPALTGTDSDFYWLTVLSIFLRTHPISPTGFSPHPSSHFGGAPLSSRAARLRAVRML